MRLFYGLLSFFVPFICPECGARMARMRGEPSFIKEHESYFCLACRTTDIHMKTPRNIFGNVISFVLCVGLVVLILFTTSLAADDINFGNESLRLWQKDKSYTLADNDKNYIRERAILLRDKYDVKQDDMEYYVSPYISNMMVAMLSCPSCFDELSGRPKEGIALKKAITRLYGNISKPVSGFDPKVCKKIFFEIKSLALDVYN